MAGYDDWLDFIFDKWTDITQSHFVIHFVGYVDDQTDNIIGQFFIQSDRQTSDDIKGLDEERHGLGNYCLLLC